MDDPLTKVLESRNTRNDAIPCSSPPPLELFNVAQYNTSIFFTFVCLRYVLFWQMSRKMLLERIIEHLLKAHGMLW